MREVIIGESVSATMPDTATAPASVKANSVNSAPVQPALEADRHVHGDQHDRHRDDRSAELARGDERRLPAATCLLLHVPVDVLHDDDRVVDHQADREHQRKQRQQVDRVAEDQHDEERADQRQRHRDQRNRSPPRKLPRNRKITMRDDDQRLDQRLHPPRRSSCVMNLVRVIDDLAGDAVGHLRLDLRESHRARAWRPPSTFASGATLMPMNTAVASAERGREVVVLRAQNDVGDVLQADDRAVLLPDRELLEFVDRVQTGAGGQVDADHLAPWSLPSAAR